MRALPLNEKISIKVRLATKGVLPGFLVRLDTASARHFWSRCFGTPLSYFATPKMWRRRYQGERSPYVHIPIAEYTIGICHWGHSTPYKTVDAKADSRQEAMEKGRKLLNPSTVEPVPCLDSTQPGS